MLTYPKGQGVEGCGCGSELRAVERGGRKGEKYNGGESGEDRGAETGKGVDWIRWK